MNHYTYRITNIIFKLHYYGTRSTELSPAKDIGIYYFSSSSDKEFIQDQKDNPSHYKYKVIKVFSSREKALELEIKLHNKFDVGINESFYNRSKQTSIGFNYNCKGLKKPKGFGEKISNRQYGIKFSDERKNNISLGLNRICNNGKTVAQNRAMKGSKNPMYGKTKELNPMYGKTHTDDVKKHLSNIKKGTKLSTQTKEKIRNSCKKPKVSKENYAKKNYYLYLFDKLILKETSSIRVTKYIQDNNIPSFYSLSKYGSKDNYKLVIIKIKD